MSGRAAWLRSALAVTLSALAVVPAHAANWLELNFYLARSAHGRHLPPCEHPAALDKISTRFSEKEGRFWNSNLSIVGFSDVRETAFRSWAAEHDPAALLQCASPMSPTASSTRSTIRSVRTPA